MESRLPGENNINYSYRVIKEAILLLELQPGQLLNVGELSETLKVSSTPIKNALWKLQQEHLVDLIPQVGSYVSKIDLDLVEEAAFLWFVLEKEYLKLACDFFPEDSLNQLKKNLDSQEILLNQQQILSNSKEWLRRFYELDENFHSIIFQSHHRSTTWKVIKQTASHYHRMITLSRTDSHFKQMIAEHKDILSIIENKEIERVESVLRNHIFSPMNDWVERDCVSEREWDIGMLKHCN